MTQIYDVGGKGKRQCPSCQKYVAAITCQCPCGHEFRKSKMVAKSEVDSDEPQEIKTYTEGGKGKKQCPKCEKYVGCRMQVCACGNTNFPKKVKEEVVKTTEPHEINTFDEGGQGKKQCASCNKFISARHQHCACGSTEFVKIVREVEEKEIHLHDEGGKGRKQCASCNKYLSARYTQCACGSTEFTKKIVERVVKTYDKLKLGRKQCPNCKAIIGGRQSKCVCGKEFEVSIVSVSGSKEDPEKQRIRNIVNNPYYRPPSPYTFGLRCKIVTPAGDCPYNLKSTDEDSIRDWARKVIESGLKNNIEYRLSALKYWSEQFYDRFRNPAEAKLVRQTLTEIESDLYPHYSELQSDNTEETADSDEDDEEITQAFG